MGEVVWVTNISKQIFAVINPVWAWYYYDYPLPSKFFLIWNEGVKSELDGVINFLKRIYECAGVKFEFEPICISEDPSAYRKGFQENVFKKLIKMTNIDSVILDITPGRKFMSVVLAMTALNLKKILNNSRIFLIYLHLLDLSYQNEPFPKIPRSKQRFIVREVSLGEHE